MPDGFDKWNPALRGAFRKGAKAFQSGEPLGTCPYADKRNDSGRLTWSRAFARCWEDGWRHAQEQPHA